MRRIISTLVLALFACSDVAAGIDLDLTSEGTSQNSYCPISYFYPSG